MLVVSGDERWQVLGRKVFGHVSGLTAQLQRDFENLERELDAIMRLAEHLPGSPQQGAKPTS